jgi:DNA-binding transcriptional MerR regulator
VFLQDVALPDDPRALPDFPYLFGEAAELIRDRAAWRCAEVGHRAHRHDAQRKVVDNGSPGIQIGEVSRAVGVTPQTLRLWESKGLVKPLRSKGGTRYYREEDLESLRRIKGLRTVEGLNLAAIRRELEASSSSSPGEDPEAGLTAERTGERLRQLRLRLGKTLEEVAEATGLTASFISKLERGISGASITSFNTIAKAYGVSAHDIFGAELEPGSPS